MTTTNNIELELTEVELDHVVGGTLPAGSISIKFAPEYTKWVAKAGTSISNAL